MKEKLIVIFSIALNKPKESIDQSISQETHADWDSINQIKIISMIEEGFDVEFDEDDIFDLDSYSKIENRLQQLIQCKN